MNRTTSYNERINDLYNNMRRFCQEEVKTRHRKTNRRFFLKLLAVSALGHLQAKPYATSFACVESNNECGTCNSSNSCYLDQCSSDTSPCNNTICIPDNNCSSNTCYHDNKCDGFNTCSDYNMCNHNVCVPVDQCYSLDDCVTNTCRSSINICGSSNNCSYNSCNIFAVGGNTCAAVHQCTAQNSCSYNQCKSNICLIHNSCPNNSCSEHDNCVNKDNCTFFDILKECTQNDTPT